MNGSCKGAQISKLVPLFTNDVYHHVEHFKQITHAYEPLTNGTRGTVAFGVTLEDQVGVWF